MRLETLALEVILTLGEVLLERRIRVRRSDSVRVFRSHCGLGGGYRKEEQGEIGCWIGNRKASGGWGDQICHGRVLGWEAARSYTGGLLSRQGYGSARRRPLLTGFAQVESALTR